MKKTLIVVAFASFLILANSADAANQDIIINEIGAYETTDYEWIEIYNRGQQPIDLTDWKFVEDFSDSKPNGTNHGLNFIQGGSTIDAGQYAVIAQNDIKFKEKYPNFTGILIDSSWNTLNESGEKIGLKYSDENFSELFTYIEAKNYSLERTATNLNDYTSNNWQEHQSSNTVGAINSNQQNNNQTITQQTSNQETNQQNNQPANTINNQGLIASNLDSNFYILNSIQANAGENIIALAGQKITFDASKSQGDISSYEWNFGDGQTAKGKIVKHKYAFPGKYISALSISNDNTSAQSQITATIYPTGVYINEFIPSPDETDDNEWIEIYNSNDFPVDISGWTIGDNSKKSFSFPPNTFIAKQNYLVIPRAITKIALNNDADALKFYYPENILIEEIRYEKAKEGYSASRKQNAGFVWTKNPTPSAPNIISGENISAQKQSVSTETEQNKTQNLIKSDQKLIVATSGFIIKNLINTAEAHHVEEEIINKTDSSSSAKSEINNNSIAESDISANISNAIQNKNILPKIFIILATLGIFALMWRVMKRK